MTYAAIVLETRISCRHVTWSWWNLRKKDVPAFAAMKTFKILLGCCQPRGGWICMALIQLQGGCEDERYGSHVKASSPLGWRDGSQCDGRILDRILWRVEGVKDDISLWPMMIWSAVVLLYGCWWRIFDCFQLQRFDRQATKTNKQALPHLSPCTSMYIISVSWRWIASLSCCLWILHLHLRMSSLMELEIGLQGTSWMHQRGR